MARVLTLPASGFGPLPLRSRGKIRNLMDLLNGISPGVAFGIVGLVGTVVSIVLTVRSLNRPRLAYRTRDLPLIGQPDATPYGDVSILFNGAPVPRLVVTRLALWNAGNTTVRRSDLVEKDP